MSFYECRNLEQVEFVTTSTTTAATPGITGRPSNVAVPAGRTKKNNNNSNRFKAAIRWSGFVECMERLISGDEVEEADPARLTTTATAASHHPPAHSKFVAIGYCSFMFCSKLHSVIGLEHVSHSLEDIGQQTFRYTRLTTFDFSYLKQLQLLENSFAGCRSLTVVDLSNSQSLRAIGQSAFWNCTALRVIHLPPNLKRIDELAFDKCRQLVSVAIPPLVEYMGSHAFQNCSGLTQVSLQSTRHLRALLNDGQFCGCTSLHTLELFLPVSPAFTAKLWPLLLEQFLGGDHNGILARAGIAASSADGKEGTKEEKSKKKNQQITIAWNFVRTNIANFGSA